MLQIWPCTLEAQSGRVLTYRETSRLSSRSTTAERVVLLRSVPVLLDEPSSRLSLTDPCLTQNLDLCAPQRLRDRHTCFGAVSAIISYRVQRPQLLYFPVGLGIIALVAVVSTPTLEQHAELPDVCPLINPPNSSITPQCCEFQRATHKGGEFAATTSLLNSSRVSLSRP